MRRGQDNMISTALHWTSEGKHNLGLLNNKLTLECEGGGEELPSHMEVHSDSGQGETGVALLCLSLHVRMTYGHE